MISISFFIGEVLCIIFILEQTRHNMKKEDIQEFLRLGYPLLYDKIKGFDITEIANYFEDMVPDIKILNTCIEELDILENELYHDTLENIDKDTDIYDKHFHEFDRTYKETDPNIVDDVIGFIKNIILIIKDFLSTKRGN